MTSIVLASHNKGKLKEMRTLLAPTGLNLISQDSLAIEAPEETGCTFVENALIKARFASQRSGHPAIADDSGLIVPALKGAPGLYTARYAGINATTQDNIKTLLSNMTTISDRAAYFYCVIVYLNEPNDPCPIIAEGILTGNILRSPVGSQGFGYDPIFEVPPLQKSLAELSSHEKNALSHRGIALQHLKQQLELRHVY